MLIRSPTHSKRRLLENGAEVQSHSLKGLEKGTEGIKMTGLSGI
jgi:hypothetical protein